MKKLKLLKYKWPVIILTLLIVTVSFIPILNIELNSDLESYLPASMPSRMNDAKIEEIFGKSDPVIILLETEDILADSTLKRIRSLSKAYNRMKEFDMVISLFDVKNIKGESGSMVVDPVVKRIPKSEKRKERLREEIKNNELAYKLVVSKDFTKSIIILNSSGIASDEEILYLIHSQLEKYPGREKISIFGMPYLRLEANNKIGRDFMILLPVGLVIMFLFLIFSFRQKRGAILPFSVVVFSIIVALTIIPLAGWEMSIIGVLIPIMMIAIANNYGVHFITRYQELSLNHPELSVSQIVSDTTQYLKKPIVLTGLTTIMGVSGLLTHLLLPAKQMGIASAIGIAFALVLSLTFLPVVLSMLKKGKITKRTAGNGKSILEKILVKIAKLTTSNPRRVIFLFVSILILSSYGLSKFKLAADNNKMFSDDHPYSHALSIINKDFGGSKNLQVLFEGDIKDPAILKRMDNYEKELKDLEEIGNINSIATIIRIMSRALNDPNDELYDRIPDTREAVAQYLELYSMSGDPEDFEDFVDFDYRHALMNIQYQADDMHTLRKIENKVMTLLAHDEEAKVVGGFSLVEKELSEAIAKGQVNSLLFAFVAIAILLFLIFRSLSAGLLGSLPLFFTVVSTFGIMGWFGFELNLVTALLSSISIGLGVDYSIHLFWRLKHEIKKGKSYEEAIHTSLKTIGRGITINAFSVMLGFAILFLSSFPYIHLFAFLIITSLFFCLIGALILIPAISVIIKPKFLNR